jgi:hypothetical protein
MSVPEIWVFLSSYEDADRRQEPEDSDSEQLRGGSGSPDDRHRNPGDGGDERQQPEADVDQRPQVLGRLLVVEPDAVVGVERHRAEYEPQAAGRVRQLPYTSCKVRLTSRREETE